MRTDLDLGVSWTPNCIAHLPDKPAKDPNSPYIRPSTFDSPENAPPICTASNLLQKTDHENRGGTKNLHSQRQLSLKVGLNYMETSSIPFLLYSQVGTHAVNFKNEPDANGPDHRSSSLSSVRKNRGRIGATVPRPRRLLSSSPF